jgi:polysaccharide export outer membrane protein
VTFFVRFSLVCLFGLMVSCAQYKQNIMFKPGKDFKPDPIQKEALETEKNYIIQKNDYLKLDVYSNQGERIIDPNGELMQSQNGQVGTTEREDEFTYLVDPDGMVKLPMLGELKLEGVSLKQAEEILQEQYSKYYKDPFVRLTYANKRVIVLGAMGGQVIPLENQNVNLSEILALAKGLTIDSKAQNIRVLRKDQVFIIDLSTIEGFKAGNMRIEPNDIVYVEPVRKPFIEGLRDYSIVFSAIASLASLVAIIVALTQ